jgi:hypothetical protein
MITAIPAAIGLFSALQEALRSKTKGVHRVRLTRHTHDFLDDFRWLTADVTCCPTKIPDIVPDAEPSTRSACDASKFGIEGVNFVPTKHDITPLLRRTPCPKSLQDHLVSHDNPAGYVINSEFELAVSVVQLGALAQHVVIREHTMHNLCDNSATVAWQHKGASSPSGPIAYLLRIEALHQRHPTSRLHVHIREHTMHNLSDNSATVAWQHKGASSTSGPVTYLLCIQALHQRHPTSRFHSWYCEPDERPRLLSLALI